MVRIVCSVEKANVLFTRALKAQPDHVNNLCKYATFLAKTIMHVTNQKIQSIAVGSSSAGVDRKAQIENTIESMLQRACTLEPSNATALSVCGNLDNDKSITNERNTSLIFKCIFAQYAP